MGILIERRWSDEDLRRGEPTGKFKRPESPYLHGDGVEDGPFPAEMDRNHLFMKAGCPSSY